MKRMHAGRSCPGGARVRSCSVIPRRSCPRRGSDPSTSRWSTRRVRRCPTWDPPTSSSVRTTWRAKSSGSSPATDPMDIAILLDNSVAAGSCGAADAPGAAGVSGRADGAGSQPASATRSPSSRWRAGRRFSPTTRSNDRAARQGDRSRLGGNVRRGLLPPRTGSSKSPRDSGNASRHAPSSWPSSGEGPELSNRHPDQVLDPLARQRRRAPCDLDWSAERRHQRRDAGIATQWWTRGRARAAARTRSC